MQARGRRPALAFAGPAGVAVRPGLPECQRPALTPCQSVILRSVKESFATAHLSYPFYEARLLGCIPAPQRL